MQILITGGFGFLGGRLGKFLYDEGNKITLGSRIKHEAPNWLPKAETLVIDWSNEDVLEKACSKADVVIHAAGMNARECEEDPEAALNFNGVTTSRLVTAASKSNVRKFIYLSTAHVYSNPLEGFITESTPLKNFHPYALSHLAGENAVLARGKNMGVVIRLSNVFGVPMSKNVNCWMLLTNDLCRQAIERRRIKLQTDGTQYRDFVAMSRVCRVISDVTNESPVVYKKILNLGSGHSKTVLEMAELIQARCEILLGFKPDLEVNKKARNQNIPLVYWSKNLEYKNLEESSVEEIDKLIIFCEKNYKYKKVI